MNIEKYQKQLDRIANIEDYLDDDNAIEDRVILLEIAMSFNAALKKSATEIEQLRFELSVAKEREKIDSTESELANARITALEGAIDAVTDSSEYDYDECPSDCSVPIDVLESMDRVRWDTDAKERGSSDE